MPLLSWLKSWSGEGQPPEKSESVMVAESLIMELEYQMKEVELQLEEKGKEERKKLTGVDYSWLTAGSQKKGYEMPQLDRLELEESCMKIKPEECGKVIAMFRDNLLREPAVEELPKILRAVIITVLDGRPKEETIPEWLTKSFTRLRPSSRVSISPIISSEDDLEMQGSHRSISIDINGRHDVNSSRDINNGRNATAIFSKSFSVDQMSIDQMSVDHMSVDQLPV